MLFTWDKESGDAYLCGCKRSKNLPLCDGTHNNPIDWWDISKSHESLDFQLATTSIFHYYYNLVRDNHRLDVPDWTLRFLSPNTLRPLDALCLAIRSLPEKVTSCVIGFTTCYRGPLLSRKLLFNAKYFWCKPSPISVTRRGFRSLLTFIKRSL
jgi:hypothetical protein